MNDDNNYNEELISKFFGGEFGHLSEIYTIEQLVFEIIGGCLTAIDLFKEQNHLIKNSEDVLKDYKNDVGKNTLEAILSLPEITTHSWLIKQNREKSLRYLKVLSLCCDINNDNSVLFFEKLTEIADVRDEFHRILDNTAENTHLIYNKSFLEEFLQSDNDKYTLILDMMYMFTLSEMDLENKFIVTLVSNTKPSNFREVYSTLLDIIRNDEESVVINAIAKLNQFSDAWKNIIVYRELEFNDYFNILITKLNNNHSIDLRLRLFKLSFRNFKECWSSGDEGWPARKIIELSRSSLLSDLNKEKNNAVKLLENFYSDLHKVNALCNKFGLQCIKFQEHLSNDDYQLDNSVTNDSWPSQFEGCQEKIESILSVMDDTCTLAIEQLELFGKGKFDVSIIKTREIEKKEREEKLRLEKLSKLNATIEVNSVEKKISIYWEELSDYPFDLDNIRDVVSNGESWLVLDYSKNLYQSQNACEWQKIALPIENISEIRYVDGIWFAMTYNNDFTFSENLSEWHLGQKPKVLEDNKYSATDDLMKFGDKWLWRITKRQEYTYTEKGLIWDTEKTGNYDKSVFYITDSLSCSWKEWNNSPYLPSGVVIKKAAIIPKSQLVMVFCAFDSWYLQDKKLEEKSNYAMYFNGSDWKRADWNDNNIKYIDRHLYFKEHLNKYYCYANGNILISEKGYIWDELLSNYYITEAPRCGSLYLFTSNSNKLYFSVDLSEYKELILEDGNWKHLTPNNDKILSVYSKDRHESFLKIGHIVLE
ncbi:hypothetical protein [Pasteurella multocida]|nr:hypothetical protein [Pasteurella multocida]WRK04353.1 hypothetical protein RFF10_06310 [Pasteurella multocida]